MARGSCCSMRRKSIRYTVLDHTGRVVQVTSSQSDAIRLSLSVGGSFSKEWYDDPA